MFYQSLISFSPKKKDREKHKDWNIPTLDSNYHFQGYESTRRMLLLILFIFFFPILSHGLLWLTTNKEGEVVSDRLMAIAYNSLLLLSG